MRQALVFMWNEIAQCGDGLISIFQNFSASIKQILG